MISFYNEIHSIMWATLHDDNCHTRKYLKMGNCDMKMIKASIFSKLLNTTCNHIEFFEPYEKNLMKTRKK